MNRFVNNAKIITVALSMCLMTNASRTVIIEAESTQSSTVTVESITDDENVPEPASRLLTFEEAVERHDFMYKQYIKLQEAKVEAEREPKDEVKLRDYRFEALVYTTFVLETGWGESDMWKYQNNPGGIKINGVYHTFASKEEGYDYMRTLLKNRYVDVYGYDIRAIRDVYCQCGPQDYYTFMEIYEDVLVRMERGEIL